MLCLLGQPRVVLDGHIEPVVLQPKALALLAYLALTEREVERRHLAYLLFPETMEPRAVLRWHLNHIRSAAPSFITHKLHTTRDQIGLSIATDIVQFRQGAKRISQFPAASDAREILALYRDDLLAGLTISASADFDTWLYIEQEGVRRFFRQAVETFARWTLSSQCATDAIGPLSRLVSVDPYFEEGHVLLIETYESLGQYDHALITYERYQHIMRKELRTEPRRSVAHRFEQAPVSKRVESREELVPLREVTIHVVDWPGAEPTIVGIHGSGLSSYSLTGLAEQLAPDIRFMALDLRGHGFSDKPPSGYDLETHVADILQLIDALALQRPMLLGHSIGGTIAAFVAAQANVSGLILLEALIGDRAFTENALAHANVASLPEDLDRRFFADFDAYLAEWRAHHAQWSDEAERLLDRWVRYELAPLSNGTYRRRALRRAVEEEWVSLVEASSLATLARVSCPILIVQALLPWGGDRPYFTDEIVATQLQAAPSAELFVARHSQHSTLIRDPEFEMVEAIRHFVHCNAHRDEGHPKEIDIP